MISTNRALNTMRDKLDTEISRMNALRGWLPSSRDAAFIDRRLASLARQRVALCAAIVNRRTEAAKNVVVFSRWANGYGALDEVMLVSGITGIGYAPYAAGRGR